eukprot:scaffold23893_cov63-Phaeocystis_antarctica.AAC.2
MAIATTLFGAALTTFADSALIPSSFHHSGLTTSSHASRTSMPTPPAVAPLPRDPSPPARAPWPRGTAARPPRSAPSSGAHRRG